MSVVSTAVKKPITTLMVLISVMIIGGISLSRLAVDYFPSVELPIIAVITTYDGAGPLEVEKSVTTVIEGGVSGVNNINYIESTSYEGRSFVTINFNWGVSVDAVATDVREKLDIIKRYLPKDSENPIIFKFSPDILPIMVIAISGSDDQEFLYDLADTQLKSKLEQVEGVASVGINGGLKKEIHVDVSRNRLEAYNINIDNLITLLAMENQNSAGGYTYEGVYKYVLRTTGEFKNLEDIRNVIIGVKRGIPVKIKDIATVSYGYSDSTGINKINGSRGISLSISKQSGQNTVRVAEGVVRQMKEMEPTLPPGIKLEVVMDSSKDIKNSIDNVRDSALLGAILAVIILMLYLWNFKTVSIIGISIPTSIIVTFIIMYFMKVTLNIVSLAGLALGVGMMVDASIVVIENVFYHRQTLKKGRFSAAIDGTSEVILAISASTFTTIAVFLPIAFMEGFISQIFRDLSLTVSISLLSSLLVSFTLIPMLASKIVSTEENRLLKPLEHIFTRFLDWIDRVYGKFIAKALRFKRWIVFLTVIVVLGLGALIVISIGKEGMPEVDEGQFRIRASFPVGTRKEFTEQITSKMEAKIQEIVGTNLRIMTSSIAGQGMMGFGGGPEYRSSIMINLIDKKKRSIGQKEVMELLRKEFINYPAQINISIEGAARFLNFGSGGSAISIEIRGDDMETGNKLAKNIVDILSKIDGVRQPQSSREDALPEVRIIINREIASKVGLNAYNISQSIKTGFGGKVATRIKSAKGTDIEVIVRLQEEDRINIDNILSLHLPTPMGKLVPLASIVRQEKGFGPISIYRKDSSRIVYVTADIFGRTIDAIMQDIQREIDEKVFIPSGFSVSYGGSFKDMMDSFLQLALTLLLSVILVYAIMASQFESLIAPFVIMFAVPFGALGSLLTLFFLGKTISTLSAIGIVVLSGIAVNNGIVLIDYMNQLMHKGLSPEQAAVEAGIRRLRPVSMTTLTTVLGLIPMAAGLGSGSELYSPLAIAISGGLSFATLFTLIFVPLAYAGIRNHFPIKKYEDAKTSPEEINAETVDSAN